MCAGSIVAEGKRVPGRRAFRTTSDASSADDGFFYFFRCNPLKSPDSAKGIQGNASDFPWIDLDFLAANSRFG
jgi:hypothetical protein